MPIKRFWFYHRQIARLRAEEDLRQASLMGAVQDGESYKKMIAALDKEIGDIMVFAPDSDSITVSTLEEEHAQGVIDPEYDRGSLLALKGAFGAGLSERD